MNPERRQELLAKYPIGDPPDPTNPSARALLDGERIVALATNDFDTAVLFDPVWCPEAYARVNEAAAAVHTAMAADGFMEYWPLPVETHDPDDRAVVLMNFVGDHRLFVCRNAADRFAHLLLNADIWYLGNCTMGIASECGGETRLLPIHRGQLLLVFEYCRECNEKMAQALHDNFRFSVLAAQSELPPGAVIDPGSPIPPTP